MCAHRMVYCLALCTLFVGLTPWQQRDEVLPREWMSSLIGPLAYQSDGYGSYPGRLVHEGSTRRCQG